MKTETFYTAAQAAHADLSNKLTTAQTEARERAQQAALAASDDVLRPRLLGIITNQDAPSAEAVTSTLAAYAAMLPAHRQRDGVVLINSLESVKKHNGLTDKQAGLIAAAIMACVHGKAHAGLIDFPGSNVWHHDLTVGTLKQWAAWIAPDAHAELVKELNAAMRDRFRAEREMARLQAAEAALGMLGNALIESASNVIHLANHTGQQQRVGGVVFEPGTNVIDLDTFANIADNGGYRRMLDAGQLEVVA